MKNFYLIPGFLGEDHDFGTLIPINPYKISHPLDGMDTFAKAFISTVLTQNNVLIGYSMGGRLALHCLEKAPNLFEAVIFISTHPGLTSVSEKKQRLLSDKKWAQCFMYDPWDLLMKKWNQQAVFQQTFHERSEKNHIRKNLHDALIGFSLGYQKDFRHLLSSVETKIYWLVGEKDQKFSELSKTLAFKHRSSQIVNVKEAGHRLHLEAPFFLTKFLNKVML